MTNEELAVKAQEGDKEALLHLWENMKRFIFMLVRERYRKFPDRCAAVGVSIDDLQQECYFAFLYAVKSFDPDKGFKFISYIDLPVRTAINRLLFWINGRKDHKPLNSAMSLDEPVSTPEDDGSPRGDFIADENSEKPFQEIADYSYTGKLHDALEKSLSIIDQTQAELIRRRYLQGQDTQTICNALHCSPEDTYRIESNAFRALQHPQSLKYLTPFRG